MSTDMQKINWPGWETVRLIGRGSFGAVYEIRRSVFGDIEKAALKVISIPQNAGDIEEMYSDGYDEESITSTFQSHLRSIVAEYSLMRKMNGCSNIVSCDDVRYVQHDDGIGWDIFIKMELLTPLTKVLPTEVPEETVVKIAKDMCSALELCKKYDIVHRDIKPQNIFVSDNGDYKLGDFGIAKTVEKTMGGTKIGTYEYMAPEVYNNQPYGSGADIYSLGLVLYWMLNERRMPFLPLPPVKLSAGMDEEARFRRFSGEPIPAPRHGSEELKRIVLKACAYDPAERYQSAAEMLADLQAMEGAVDAPAVPLAAAAPVENDNEATVCVRQEDREATVGVFSKKEDTTERDASPEETAHPAEENSSSEESSVPEETASGKPETPLKSKSGKKRLLVVAAACLLIIGGIIIAVYQKNRQDTKPQDQMENTQTTTLPTESTTEAPTQEKVLAQPDWTGWANELPKDVTEQDYEIEAQTLFSSRQLQTTSSTTSKSMEGWELYNTAEGNGDYGSWSDWSGTPVSKSSTRDVDTQTRYRYSDKETTTASDSSLSGWTLYDTTYSWGSYGNWSDWSTDSVSGSDSRQVEKKTQYRYRDISYSTEYTDWSDWSGWQDSSVTADDYTQVETRTIYAYYYYLCKNCGAHMHGWNFNCATWANGCGNYFLQRSDWVILWSTTPHSSVSFSDWYGTGKYYAYVDGVLVFKWNDGMARGEAVKTQYRYATRSTQQVKNTGSWSSWSDTTYSESSTREVQTRTLYRYRDRSKIPTYHFYRWGNWSSWSATAVSESGSRKVETATFYRYRDRVKQTTYYFRKWSDWTEYANSPADPSDKVEVRTKTQYRYRSRGEKSISADKNGWNEIDGKWYYFSQKGVMQVGWQKVDKAWYYLDESGAMVTDWQKISGKWYFFLSPSGAMQTGWQNVDNIWYYLGDNGVMVTGWKKIDGFTYYFKSDGAMQTGWQDVDNIWYYLGDNGVMVTGWKKIDGLTYYFKSNGAMQTGWQDVNNIWYYLGDNGAMVTGWKKIDGIIYYFKSNGAMARNETLTIDGKSYRFNDSGACSK